MSMTRVIASLRLGFIPVARVLDGSVVRKQFAGFTRDHARHRACMWLALNEWGWDE